MNISNKGEKVRKMHSNIVGRHAKNKKLYSNILQISQEAKAMKMKYSDVIDATVGMLYHEEGQNLQISSGR